MIQIFANGLGLTVPPAVAGQLAGTDPLSVTTTTPVVTIGGVPAEVLFSGLAPQSAGLYQVNVRVPAGVQTGDAVALQIQMRGSNSNIASVAVH